MTLEYSLNKSEHLRTSPLMQSIMNAMEETTLIEDLWDLISRNDEIVQMAQTM